MPSDQLQTALKAISDSLGSALAGVAKMTAENWAISEALREASPELHAKYLAHTSSDQYRVLQSAASYQIVLAEVLGKVE